jgi:hypothetical protein
VFITPIWFDGRQKAAAAGSWLKLIAQSLGVCGAHIHLRFQLS